jgi:DNA-binding protein HU-beta
MKRSNQINKAEFIEELAAVVGLTASETEHIVNTFIKMIYTHLHQGEMVNISGFGRFSVSHRESRIGVNPRSPGQKITIPELNTPKFKAGEAFKAAVKLRK